MRRNEFSYEERADDEEHEALGRPFRVRARLYNNRLIKARIELGFSSAMEAARKLGLNVTMIRDYEKLAASPMSKETGDWKPSARMLADALGYSPEELWPEAVLAAKQRFMELEVGSRAIALGAGDDPEHDRLEIATEVRRAVGLLPPRQAEIIAERFGLETGEEKTAAEIGEKLSISTARIHQIQQKALRRLADMPQIKLLDSTLDRRFVEQVWRCRWGAAWSAIGVAVVSTHQKLARERAKEAAQREWERLAIEEAHDRQKLYVVKSGEVACWCPHLDVDRLRSPNSEWAALPSTSYILRGEERVSIHWFVGCFRCWRHYVLESNIEHVVGTTILNETRIPARHRAKRTKETK